MAKKYSGLTPAAETALAGYTSAAVMAAGDDNTEGLAMLPSIERSLRENPPAPRTPIPETILNLRAQKPEVYDG